MVNEHRACSYLHQSITLAKMLESRVSPFARKTKLTFVGFGFLIRNRRLAQAILRLGIPHAYEGRMLLRSMLEIKINYSWIRICNREHRANRFIMFHPLDQIKILEDLPDFYDPTEYQLKLKDFKTKRAKVRHLFRHRNREGKLKWDRSWASSASLESRLRDVLKSETGNYDAFLYSLYRWISSAIHGEIHSFREVLDPVEPLKARSQPERNPVAQIVGAFAILISTIRALAMDAQELVSVEADLLRLEDVLRRLKW